ncbi:MAG: CRISPR-associated protein [Clostridia bacterium]
MAARYAAEAGKYAEWDRELLLCAAKNAADRHDLGKLDGKNQNVLSGETAARILPVNHVDAGAAHFLRDASFSPLCAAVIQAHHIGFPDFSVEANKGDLAFRDRKIASYVDAELPVLEVIHKKLVGESVAAPGDETIHGDPSVFLRMLLSCLADADHTDAALHYGKYPAVDERVPLRPEERLARLDVYVAQLQQANPASDRNALRQEMYTACRNANIPINIASCDGPVGIGKTMALMAHLLAQAKRRGLRRIFVVLPFTNIIRQSVETYRKALTLPGENAENVVAELHYRVDFESEEVRHLTALWRAPIVVTTAAAFFETLSSNSPATLRRLHELPGSAIFVDESHAALPASLLPLAWRWIKTLSSQWNCYWLLASGSLSRFWMIPQIASVVTEPVAAEIVGDDLRDRILAYEHRRIAYLYDPQPKSAQALGAWVTSFSGPRLVILNTVQSAAIVANYFAKAFGRARVEHLSTALKPDDRECTLNGIKARLKDHRDDDWTLVATSCIEAGVDLSFRNGFHELATLTSLLQTAGRIDREGNFEHSQMWTFQLAQGGGLKLNPDFKQASAVLKGYFEQGLEITPGLTTQSIADEIALYGLNGKHRKLVEWEMLRNFPDVARAFKVIDSDTKVVIVDADAARRLRDGTLDWRELQNASVQIAKHKLEELGTPRILDEIYEWNMAYDSFLGYMAGIVHREKKTVM